MALVHQLPQQRSCSHCHMPGHNVRVCREAYVDGMTMHNLIIEIINVNIDNYDDDHDTLNAIRNTKIYLNNLTLRQLKLITYVHRDLNIFASNLYHNYLVTLSQTSCNTKRDILVILGFYYEKIYLEFMLMRTTNPIEEQLLEEQLRSFSDTARRHYRRNPNLYIPLPNKFTITTNVQLSNKGDNFECPICYEEVSDNQRITEGCGHEVCVSCFDRYLSGLDNKKPICCMCRSNITNISFTQEDCCNIIKNKFL